MLKLLVVSTTAFSNTENKLIVFTAMKQNVVVGIVVCIYSIYFYIRNILGCCLFPMSIATGDIKDFTPKKYSFLLNE